jgi:hypothetical protein
MAHDRFTSEFESLIEGYLEEDLTPPQCARFQALLEAEPALVTPLLSSLRMEALLRAAVSLHEVDALDAATPPGGPVGRSKPARPSRVLSWIAAAACLALLVALAALVFSPVERQKETAPVGRPAATGSILCELWLDMAGVAVSNLTSDPRFPRQPSGVERLTLFETPSDRAQNYGARVRGYLHPPATGEYIFWIAADDQAELWLSPDDRPAGKVRIARVAAWSGPRDWFRDAGQHSGPIPLEAGRIYYIEALHKQGEANDCLAVAWEGPGRPQEVIPGKFLSPPRDPP